MTIQMKATEQYFPVVLFMMLYKVVLTFEFVDEILKCVHSNESYGAALNVVLFSQWMKPYGVTISMKPPQQHIHAVLFIVVYVLYLVYCSLCSSNF